VPCRWAEAECDEGAFEAEDGRTMGYEDCEGWREVAGAAAVVCTKVVAMLGMRGKSTRGNNQSLDRE
jgi:hypothetical protein